MNVEIADSGEMRICVHWRERYSASPILDVVFTHALTIRRVGCADTGSPEYSVEVRNERVPESAVLDASLKVSGILGVLIHFNVSQDIFL